MKNRETSAVVKLTGRRHQAANLETSVLGMRAKCTSFLAVTAELPCKEVTAAECKWLCEDYSPVAGVGMQASLGLPVESVLLSQPRTKPTPDRQ